MRGGKTSLLPPQSAATRNPSHRLFGNRDGQVKERTGRGIEESLAVLFCPPGSFIFRRAANRRRGFSFGSVVPCALDSMDAEIIECWQSWDRNRGSSHCRWFLRISDDGSAGLSVLFCLYRRLLPVLVVEKCTSDEVHWGPKVMTHRRTRASAQSMAEHAGGPGSDRAGALAAPVCEWPMVEHAHDHPFPFQLLVVSPSTQSLWHWTDTRRRVAVRAVVCDCDWTCWTITTCTSLRHHARHVLDHHNPNAVASLAPNHAAAHHTSFPGFPGAGLPPPLTLVGHWQGRDDGLLPAWA